MRHFALALLALTAFTGSATAGDGVTSVYAKRGLILKTGFLRPVVQLFAFQASDGADLGIGNGLVVDWGAVTNLEIGLKLAPNTFSPEAGLGDTRLSARYLLLPGDFQLAAEVGFTLSGDSDRRPHKVDVIVPMRWYATPFMRLEFRPGVIMNFPAKGDTTADLNIGLGYIQNLTGTLYFDLQLALVAPKFSFDTGRIPLDFQLGYSLTNDAGDAILDFFATAGFSNFISFAKGGDTLNAYPWQAGLGVRGYFGIY